jgi:cysteinyl-tRNA synthetase
MYVCGPTVYDEPHIGHARSAYIFDVVRRYLIYKGYKVTFVRNVTDVDDKIIGKARNEYRDEDLKLACKKVAEKYLASYHEALNSLGITTGAPEVIEPKASEYIGKMIDFIKILIDKGAAYQAGGDVYFDITKAKDYGKLSNQSLEKMESGARVMPLENKRNPLDFALWKSAKENEPSWDSPWGEGRPGWHIECSVMSLDILGNEFDIHGGGLDLIFPHHENEIAQSESAGNKFAKIWMHHGLLTINGQKMAKSLGNFVTVKDFLEKYENEDILKLFFLSAHYSHPIDYTDEKIKEARQALQRFEVLLDRIINIKITSSKNISDVDFIERSKREFFEAMDNDFNTPQALGCLFDLITNTHKFIETHQKDVYYDATINLAGSTLRELAKKVLGLSLLRSIEGFSDEELSFMNQYLDARKAKDYKYADELREQLRRRNIAVEIAKDGQSRFRRI